MVIAKDVNMLTMTGLLDVLVKDHIWSNEENIYVWLCYLVA